MSKLAGPKKVFLITGEDRVGVIADLVAKLAAPKISITATQAVGAGSGRFGTLPWAEPRDVKRAAQAFGIA